MDDTSLRHDSPPTIPPTAARESTSDPDLLSLRDHAGRRGIDAKSRIIDLWMYRRGRKAPAMPEQGATSLAAVQRVSVLPNPHQARLARLQRECDASTAPVLLLATASVALMLALGLNAVFEELMPAPTDLPVAEVRPLTSVE